MRYWTVEEARAYLPRLRELVETVRDNTMAAAQARGNGHTGADTEAVRAAVAELEEGDIILRDPQSGIVDYHALGSDGVEYFLCWRRGEDELGWWHLPEEGFAGRKPLPRDPE